MILRDLIARITIQTDDTQLKKLDQTMSVVKRSIIAVAGTVLSGFAIKAGQNILELEQNLKNMAGRGFGAIDTAMKKLKGPGSIFDDKTVTLAALNLKKLGFSGAVVAELLEKSAILSGRTTDSIDVIATRLGTAIQRGGLGQFFVEFGLMAVTAAEDFDILSGAIGRASGELSPRKQRELRTELAKTIDENRAKLKAELENLEKSPAGASRRLTAQMANLWNQITKIITETLQPALNKVAKIMGTIALKVKEFRDAIREAGGISKLFFKTMRELFPEHTDFINDAQKAWDNFARKVDDMFSNPIVVGATIGGIIMFLLTGRAKWVVASLAVGVLADLIGIEWDAAEKKLKFNISFAAIGGATIGGLLMFLVTKNPAWILTGAVVGGSLGKLVDDFGEDLAESLSRTGAGESLLLSNAGRRLLVLSEFLGISPPGTVDRLDKFREQKKELGRGTEVPVSRGGSIDPSIRMEEVRPAGKPLGSINIENFKLEINGAGDPDAVGKAVVREFRAAAADLLAGLT